MHALWPCVNISQSVRLGSFKGFNATLVLSFPRNISRKFSFPIFFCLLLYIICSVSKEGRKKGERKEGRKEGKGGKEGKEIERMGTGEGMPETRYLTFA